MAGTTAVALVLGFCVAIASAQYGWRPKQEYKYILNGRALVNMPSMGEWASGVHYQGLLRIQSYSSEVLIGKLQNITYTRLHTEMPDGWWGEIPTSEDNFHQMPLSESTFSIKMHKGTVDNLVMTSSIDDWEMNFIQGLVSHLQFDLSGSNAIHNSKSNDIHGRKEYMSTPIYSVMEESVGGLCEVQYQVTRLPKPVLWANPDWAPRADLCGSRSYMEVTKTRNYSNCEKRAEYHFGLPKSVQCTPGGDRCGDFWTRSSLTRMIGCGDRKDFLLLGVVGSNRVFANLHLHNGTEAAVNSYLNITLVSAKSQSNQFSLPTPPTRNVQSLMYQYNTPVFETSSSNCQSPTPISSGGGGTRDRGMYSSTVRSRRKPRSSSRRDGDKRHRKSTTTTQAPTKPVPEEHYDESTNLWQLPPPNFVHAPHRPFSAFSLAHREGDAHSCMVHQLKELITDIANDLEAPKVIPEKMTLEKVNLAVEMCRNMMHADLLKSVSGIMDIQPRVNKLLLTEKKIFRDVYAMCGTSPAFSIMKLWIEQKKIKGEEAAQLISSLPSHLQTPDASVIQQFYEMTRSSAVGDDLDVKSSAVLAFSNLLRVACVQSASRNARYPMQVLGSLCSKDTATRYIPWLSGQLRTDTALRRVYLSALGNTAHLMALPPLKSMAEDSSATPYMRSMAVLAMKYFVLQIPQDMLQTLMEYYQNYDNPLAVRMASFSMLIYAHPGLAVWQRIAIHTWYEPSPVMVSFIRSSLASMAAAKDPTYQYMFESAKSVLALAKPATLSSHRPHNLLWTSVNNELNQVVLDHLCFSGNIQGAHIYHRLTRRLGGLSRVATQTEVWTANPDGLLELVRDFMNPGQDLSVSRPHIPELQRPTRWIREALKIAARNLPRIEGELHLKFNSLNERIFTFDRKTVSDFLRANRKGVEQMRAGKEFHYQKVDQEAMEIATTTEMGFPVSFRLRTLWAFRSTGESKLSSNHKELSLDLSIVYASQLMSELSMFPAWDGVEDMAASYGTTMLQMPPLRLRTAFNNPEHQLQVNLEVQSPDEQVVLVSHQSKAFTAQRDILNLIPASLSKATHFFPVSDKRQMITIPHLDVTYASEGEPAAMLDWIKGGIFVYGFPMMWHSLKPGYFMMELNEMAPIQMNFTIGTAEMKEGDLRLKSMAETYPEAWKETTTEDNEDMSESPEVVDQAHTTSSEEATQGPSSTTEPTTASSIDQGGSTSATTNPPEEVETDPTVEDMKGISISDTEEKSTNEFNVTTINPFTETTNGSSFNYLLSHTLSGIRSGRAFVIGVNATVQATEPQHYTAFLVGAQTTGSYTRRAAMFLNSKDTKWQMGVTSTLYSVSVPLYNVQQILNHNLTAKIAADVMFRSDTYSNLTTMKATVSRSEEMTNKLRASAEAQRCLLDVANEGIAAYLSPQCRLVAQQASFSDHITANFGVDPNEREQIAKGLPIDPTAARAVIKLSGFTDTADLWIRTHSYEMEYTGLPLTPIAGSVLRHYSPSYSVRDHLFASASCGIRPDHVTTYDGVQFDYHITDCWHVLSKDCSGKSRVVVLARTVNNVTEVEVNVDNYKVVSLRPDMRIAVNKKPLALANNQVAEIVDRAGTALLQLSSSPDRVVRLNLPEHDFTVLYSNSSVLISVGIGTRGRLCGLCGDNDGEKVGEFKNPRGVLERYAFDFASSYELQENNCKSQSHE